MDLVTQPVHGQMFAGLNPLDWALVLMLGFGAVTGFTRGLVRSVVSLLGIAAGLVLAAWYASPFAATVVRWVRQPALAEIVAFFVIFAAVFLASSLLGRALRSASQAVGLGLVDRVAGAAFGLVRAVLIVAVLLVPAGPFLGAIPYTRDSVLLPYLRSAAHGVSFVVPQDFGNRVSAGVRQMEPKDPAGSRAPLHREHRTIATPNPTEGDRP